MLLEQQIKPLIDSSLERLNLNRYLDNAIKSMKEGKEGDAIDQLKSGLKLAHLSSDNEWVLRFNAYLNLFI